VKSHGTSESPLLWEGVQKEHRFVIRFTGFAPLSVRQGQYEYEDVRKVRSCGLRQGPRNFDFLNPYRIAYFGKIIWWIL
jgi:hypothetical protein